MALLKFTNNANTTLANAISNTATSVTVAAGTGVKFPAITGSQYFRATIIKSTNSAIFEIVKVTAVSTDTFTIIRAQEGTSALSWAVGDFFELLPTAADLADLVQQDDLQANTGNYAADSGSANAYVVALTPALSAHITGMPIRFKAANACTGASTFNDGAGALALVMPEGGALVAGDIVAGGIYIVAYDGTRFQLISSHRTGFTQLSGQIQNAQVPVGAVTQWEASLVINGGQISGGSVEVPGLIAAGPPLGGSGDLSANRSNGTGVVFLGNSDTYVFFAGSAYVLPNFPVQSTGFQVTSDKRLKEEIVEIPDALAKVCLLRGVTFKWRANGNVSAGIIAQDVERVLPEAIMPMHLVEDEDDGSSYLTVNESALVGLLIEALKEERVRRIACEDRITAIEARLNGGSR